jgi:ABC-2 type transport system ATP-binding protein
VEFIKLKGVKKEYNNMPILDEVNLTIEENDMYGIIGESGSGKTTLLNLITGFIEPSFGNIEYYSKVTHGPKNLNKNLAKIKKYIGFTPQHNSFYPKLTVKENLVHFGRLYGLNEETMIKNAKSILHFTQLFEHRNKLAEFLSEGMQRRLDIACSLIHKPKLLVLDEPTADLDPVLQAEILQFLQEINKQGTTIVIASHHLDSIENVCNKVAIIHKGKVHSEGLIDDVKKPFLKDNLSITIRPGSNKEQIINNLKEFPIEKIIDKGNQLIVFPKDVEKTVSFLLRFIQDENLYLNDMDVRKPSLNEIFEKISKKEE